MIVVSDTSPITNLAAVGQLSLLQKLYGNVVIPDAVYQELTSAGDKNPGCLEVKEFSWITVKSVRKMAFVEGLQQLDQGEAEGIALALELQADWLLIDESLGRQVAATHDLPMIGVLGILIEAKHRSLISAVKPVLDELISRADFWVSPKLYERVLAAVEES